MTIKIEDIMKKVYSLKRGRDDDNIDLGCDLLDSIQNWEDDGKIVTIEDLKNRFPTERDCYHYLTYRRWEGNIICPYENCNHDKIWYFIDGIRYKCQKCLRIFTAKTDTFMEASKLPTIKWLQGVWLYTHNPTISTMDLHRILDITQKSAWRMKKRLIWALSDEIKTENNMKRKIVTFTETQNGYEKIAKEIIANLEGYSLSDAKSILKNVEWLLEYNSLIVPSEFKK